MMSDPDRTRAVELPRVLGSVAAFCVVVGSVIGSAIFIVPARIAHMIPSIGSIAFVWLVGGAFATAGALTLAELAAMLPRAGGPYVYLREAYGNLPAFLFGWCEFLVVRAGSMAALAAAFTKYFFQLRSPPSWGPPELWYALVACAAIAVVTTINVLGTLLGGGVQVVGTVLKVGGVIALITLPFIVGGADSSRLSPVWPPAFNTSLVSGMMIAMVSVLWAYDGWVSVTPLAEEIRNPGRNIPRALGLGMAVLVVLYLSTTLMYHAVLPMEEITSMWTEKAANKAVAAVYCERLVGPHGVTAISLLVMCSTFISLNSNILTGPRASFAMARDGLFPAALGRVHPRFQTPTNAILIQSAWAIGLTLLGTITILWPAPSGTSLPRPIISIWTELNRKPLYDILTDYVVFGANLFYMLSITAVFVLRRRRPELPRPYRTFGYPVTPILYVLAAVYFLGDMLYHSPAEAFAGLGIIALGLVFYFLYPRRASLPQSQ
jgi:APA family basic amino acid/polyamine antiporter